MGAVLCVITKSDLNFICFYFISNHMPDSPGCKTKQLNSKSQQKLQDKFTLRIQ